MKCLFALILFFSLSGNASSVFEFKNVSVSSNVESEFAARKDLEKKAIHQTIRKQVKSIVGSESYKTNYIKLTKEIIPKSKNIITSIVEKKMNFAKPTSFAVYDINLSQKSLLNLLKKNGFFVANLKQSKILPLIAIKDKVNFKNYFWWGGNNPFALKFGKALSKSLHKELKREVEKNKNIFITPIKKNYHKQVDSDLKFVDLKSADYIALANQFKADMILTGSVTIKKNSKKRNAIVLSYDFKAIDIKTYTEVARLSKQYSTLPGSFKASLHQGVKDSKAQIASLFSKLLTEGRSLDVSGSKNFLLKLNGDLKYKQYNRLKNELKVKIGAVNSLVEKEFKPGAITLELNSPSALESVERRIRSARFGKLKINVTKESDSSLLLDVSNQ